MLIVGLGPAGLDRLAARALRILDEPERTVFVRTLQHPAAAELANRRSVVACDDLYQSAESFDEVYLAIADRVVAALQSGPVAYAVPGSAAVGERAVTEIRRRVGDRLEVFPGESFLDLLYLEAGVDPIASGVKVLDGRDLPDPLIFDTPVVITQIDRPEVLADVSAELGRVLEDTTSIIYCDRLGDEDQIVDMVPLADLSGREVGPRTSLLINAGPVGWYGLVVTNRILRKECPWDRKQTHHSLLSHLIEEAYETAEAIRALPAEAPGGDPDYVGYAAVEEELGDLLLQVVFHATLAREVGAFDVEEVAEIIRRKLVNRHPHVFGEVIAEDATTVVSNWEMIKGEEKARQSLMDDIPVAMPAIIRADKMQRRAKSAGFDWDDVAPVFEKVLEEVDELTAASADARAGNTGGGVASEVSAELGDLLFAVVNLARHLGVDPELALAGSSDRFAARFRLMEEEAAVAGRPLRDHTLEELDALWERAKSTRTSQ